MWGFEAFCETICHCLRKINLAQNIQDLREDEDRSIRDRAEFKSDSRVAIELPKERNRNSKY